MGLCLAVRTVSVDQAPLSVLTRVVNTASMDILPIFGHLAYSEIDVAIRGLLCTMYKS